MNVLNAQALAVWLVTLSSIAVAKPRIIGGADAIQGRFDYGQVSLQLGGLHVCGGALVASNLVLTAAHCRRSFDTIVVNAYNIPKLSDSSENRETFKPRRSFIHPAYEKETDSHDAMIVELDGIIDDIDPVVINKHSAIPSVNDSLLVLGWGMTVFGDESSYAEVLQIAELDYIQNEDCKSQTNENGQSLGDWILEDHLCAWKEQKDACAGDSGSPLILPGNSQKGDVLVGIVSWGVDCAGPLPGVYSRTSFIFSWLEEVICTLSSNPPDNMDCDKFHNTTTIISPNTTTCTECDPKKSQEEDASRKRVSGGMSTRNSITWPFVCAVNLIIWLCIHQSHL